MAKKKINRWVIRKDIKLISKANGKPYIYTSYLIHITGLFGFHSYGALEDAHRFRLRKNAAAFIKQHNMKKCKPEKIIL